MNSTVTGRVGLAPIETARIAHRVVESILAVFEAVRNALAQVPRDLLLDIARHVLPDDVTAERKRQARFLEPPRAHVGDEMQSLVLVSELTLVDQQSGIHVIVKDGVLDLIEGYDYGSEIRLK